MNSFETVSLDQFDDAAKTGLHIGRQRFEFISNAIIVQLYNPSHLVTLLHFCNAAKRMRVLQRAPWRVTKLLRQYDTEASKPHSQMMLQRKRKALAELNRQANEAGPGLGTAKGLVEQ
jgi:hypothetical protein